MKRILTSVMLILLAACSGAPQGEADYPKNRDQLEEERVGKLTGEDGIVLFGGKKKSSGDGINVNSYLWRATLDTIYFMPLVSADPFGGVVLTDWYQLNPKSKERIKLNIYILGSELRSDAIRVSVFKQRNDSSKWVDVKDGDAFGEEIENKILLRAREIKVASPN